jgi:hypothetical protein
MFPHYGSLTSNGINGVKPMQPQQQPNASVEYFERQVADARREAELVGNRLRAVIRQTTHHQDTWK